MSLCFPDFCFPDQAMRRPTDLRPRYKGLSRWLVVFAWLIVIRFTVIRFIGFRILRVDRIVAFLIVFRISRAAVALDQIASSFPPAPGYFATRHHMSSRVYFDTRKDLAKCCSRGSRYLFQNKGFCFRIS